MADLLTTRQVADLLGSDEWRIRRLYENGNLPEPDRLGGKRVIRRSDVPTIAKALKARGWLSDAAPGPVSSGKTAG